MRKLRYWSYVCYSIIMRGLEEANIFGKRVLLRLDADVPIHQEEGVVLDDFRLRRALPTINYLLNRKAKVILMAHLGRPQGKRQAKMSLKPVFIHLAAMLKKPIQFAPVVFSEKTKISVKNLAGGEILALENLRFEAGEERDSRSFALKLSKYGEVFVNEAFALSHRHSASTVAICEFLPAYAGLNFEQEYEILRGLMTHPAKPYVALIGGAKVVDKLPLIKSLLTKADLVLVGGAVANTFLATQGIGMRESLVERRLLPQSREIIKFARGRLLLPSDLIWHRGRAVDIGAKTVEDYTRRLRRAKTIFWNGTMGIAEESRFANGSEVMARLIAQLPATSVVGGGDTVAVLSKNKLIGEYSFVSTGGGATLSLLSGQILPGVRALSRRLGVEG